MGAVGLFLACAALVAAVLWRFPYWYTPFTIGSFLFFDRLSERFTGRSVVRFLSSGHWRTGVLIYLVAAGIAFVVDVIYGRMLAGAWVYPPWRGIANIGVPVLFHYPFGFLSLYATFQTARGLSGSAGSMSEKNAFEFAAKWYARVSPVMLTLCLAIPLFTYRLNGDTGESQVLLVVMVISTVAVDGVREALTGDSMLRELVAGGWRYAAAIIFTLAWAIVINEGPNVFAREWVYLTSPFGLPLWAVLILGWPFLLVVSTAVYETTLAVTSNNLVYTNAPK